MAASPVYLDYNATTPLACEVKEVITEALHEAWGNPSSSHQAGVKAKQLISTSREHIAKMLNAKSPDIIFTSGGTEGNNWILRMALEHFRNDMPGSGDGYGDVDREKGKPHFITSNVEHDSVKCVLEQFQESGLADVSFVPVQATSGCVRVEDVLSAVTPATIMVSVMLANNETGVVQPVRDICKEVKQLVRKQGETRRILLHTDAAQAIGKMNVDVQDLGVDYLTVVGHKFYGPRIGAVYVRHPNMDAPVYPILFGGGQERNFRSGTENTPMIAGLGKAAELVCLHLDEYHQNMKMCRNYLEEKLKDAFGDKVSFNGKCELSERLPNTCNVSFTGTTMKGNEILNGAPGVLASVGAACHSQDRPSHILLAMGVAQCVARSAVRISVGRETSSLDIDKAVEGFKLALS